MRVYLEYAKKSFQNNLVYRLDYFSGVINSIVMIFINIAIWKAIFEEEDVLGGVQFKMLTTYIILSFLMQCIFNMDEFLIENKIKSGLISFDFLKPINFRLYIFSYHIGNLVFKILMQLMPTLIVCIIFFKLLPPFSLEMGIYFIFSSILGFLVLYNLNFIIWTTSFWFYWVFSLVTIKDAIILIFSGALVPLWFMPQWLSGFIKLTPFESIFYIPISIYLGRTPGEEIILSIMKQIFWIVFLFTVGHVLLNRAMKRLVIQGG